MERQEGESLARSSPVIDVRRSLTCGGQKEGGQPTSPSFTTTIAGLEASNSQLNNKLFLLESCHQDNLVEIRGMQDKVSVLSLNNQQMCSALQPRGAKDFRKPTMSTEQRRKQHDLSATTQQLRKTSRMLHFLHEWTLTSADMRTWTPQNTSLL